VTCARDWRPVKSAEHTPPSHPGLPALCLHPIKRNGTATAPLSDRHESTHALFSSQKFLDLATVALSFYLIISVQPWSSKDMTRNCVISFFCLYLILHACVQRYDRYDVME
jgi:hypothetical protein